jgi:hypothetical protein
MPRLIGHVVCATYPALYCADRGPHVKGRGNLQLALQLHYVSVVSQGYGSVIILVLPDELGMAGVSKSPTSLGAENDWILYMPLAAPHVTLASVYLQSTSSPR